MTQPYYGSADVPFACGRDVRAPLAITSGEPAGIGPDLCLALAAQHEYDSNSISKVKQGGDERTTKAVHSVRLGVSDLLAGSCPLRSDSVVGGEANAASPMKWNWNELVVLADKELLQQRAALLGLNVQLHDYDPQQTSPLPSGHLRVLHIPLPQAVQAGKLNPANSPYVLDLLRRAVQGCQSGEFAGMVTAPVHKGVINDAGIPFSGHTEFLAGQTHTARVVMMLAGGGLRVALATTHLALRDVAEAITPALLEDVLTIIQQDLTRRFGIARPRILVAGLNPHAGEDGYLGREEIDIMIPVLNRLRALGMNVSAPLPADTLFTPQRLAQCDCVLAMYHDQGLPVLKYASFGQGVNVTLGLPIIRTSVDHGTALDLAGTGRAEAGSLMQAIQMAADMAEKSFHHRDTETQRRANPREKH